MFDDLALARALHVLCLVHWIGGVSFITLVILPLARRHPDADYGRALFASVEHRFASQVRFSLPLAGAAGFWMSWKMDLWGRFGQASYWWMTSMVGVWLIFMLLIFVLEPLLHARFERMMQDAPQQTFRLMSRVHAVLLTVAGLTILGAVAGVQGYLLFQ